MTPTILNLKTKNYIIFKMKIILLLFLLKTCLSSQLPTTTQPFESQITPAMLVEYEHKIERERTEYVQKNILDRIFGPGRSTVIVDVTVGVRTITTKAQAGEKRIDTKRKLGEIEYVLPGIPRPGSIAESAVPTEAKSEGSGTEQINVNTEIVIQKQNVTVIYDERIKETKVQIAREAIISALRLDPKDKNNPLFKPAKFTSSVWERFLETLILPKYLIPLILSLLIAMFLFGPVTDFLKNYVRMLRERNPTEISIDSKLERQGGEGIPTEGTVGGVGGGGIGTGITEAELAEKEKEREKEEKYIPFSYINEENLKRLVYLIAKEDPSDIAIVLSYLKPEFVKTIIESFSPQLQAEVAVALAQAREIPQEEVLRIDNYLKERIDFLVGGIHHLMEILQKVDKTTRDNILEYLKNEKPEIYNKVRPQIFLFEDILEIPDITLQTIIRELKPENIARALRNAPQELISKFFKNMSEGAQALVKEEMDYGRPLTKEQIEEEQTKIIEVIKKMEAEGKIYLKERSKVFIDASEVTTVSKERNIELSKGYQYYLQGVTFYENGDYENAINYLQYATELDPQLYEAYQYLGNIYYNAGLYDTALEYYKKVVELNPQDKEFASWVEEFENSITAKV